jgi:hypothetical protein
MLLLKEFMRLKRIPKLLKHLYNLYNFKKDFHKKQELLKDGRFKCEEKDLWPILNENIPNTLFDHHYLYHPAWAIRMLASNTPERHVDICSPLSFISMASAILPID